MRIERNDLIFSPQEDVQCHAGQMIRTEDGGVLAVWFQGSREGADDVCIYGARFREDGGWEEPRRLTPQDGLPHWNPVLFRRRDGVLLLFFKRGREIPFWQTLVSESRDEGQNWTDPVELVPGDRGGRGPVRNRILRLSDGSLLAPASVEQGEWRCFMDRSEDEGKTWERTEDIRLTRPEGESPTPFGAIQPALWEDESGVHALLRTTQGQLFRTDSTDLGRTWSAPLPTGLPNNNSGMDLAQASDGTLYLVCNPVGQNWGARSPLSVLYSTDGGGHWMHLTHLVTMPGEYSYPSVLAQDGCLWILHTWQRHSMQFWRLRLSD